MNLDSLQAELGYHFDDLGLLEAALTHRSYRNEKSDVDHDNERLEFLGDAALGLFIAQMLYRAHPNAGEGQLTRWRAELVCEGGLEAVAKRIGVGEALRLGKGEERSGGRDKPRLLASALEAIVGAIMLDGGPLAVAAFSERHFAEPATEIEDVLDPKSSLQDQMQRAGSGTPTYELLETSGPDHERTFRVAVRVGDDVLAEGIGRSKARAERKAAAKALRTLAPERD